MHRGVEQAWAPLPCDLPSSSFLTSIRPRKQLNIPTCMQNGNALKATSMLMKADREYILQVVKLNGEALKNVAPMLKNDQEVVLSAIASSSAAVRHAGGELRKDRKFVLEAFRQCPDSLKYAPREVRDDAEFMLHAMAVNAVAFDYISSHLRHNRSFLLQAIEQYHQEDALMHVPPEFREDVDFVKECVAVDGTVLSHAAKDMQDNEEIVLAAVEQEGSALQFASARIQDMKEVVLAAVIQNCHAYKFASKRLKRDHDVRFHTRSQDHSVVLAFDAEDKEDTAEATEKASKKLRKNGSKKSTYSFLSSYSIASSSRPRSDRSKSGMSRMVALGSNKADKKTSSEGACDSPATIHGGKDARHGEIVLHSESAHAEESKGRKSPHHLGTSQSAPKILLGRHQAWISPDKSLSALIEQKASDMTTAPSLGKKGVLLTQSNLTGTLPKNNVRLASISDDFNGGLALQRNQKLPKVTEDMLLQEVGHGNDHNWIISREPQQRLVSQPLRLGSQ